MLFSAFPLRPFTPSFPSLTLEPRKSELFPSNGMANATNITGVIGDTEEFVPLTKKERFLKAIEAYSSQLPLKSREENYRQGVLSFLQEKKDRLKAQIQSNKSKLDNLEKDGEELKAQEVRSFSLIYLSCSLYSFLSLLFTLFLCTHHFFYNVFYLCYLLLFLYCILHQ